MTEESTRRSMKKTKETWKRTAMMKIADQTAAALVLTKHLISTHAKESNFVFSPLSLHIVLGMLEVGSSGPTRDQILGFLSADSSEALNELFSQIVSRVLVDGSQFGGPVSSCSNGLWVDQSLTLKPAYQLLLDKAYSADSNHVDFKNKASEAAEEVNTWVCNKTNGKIKDILPPDAIKAEETMLILANAVYFKGKWEQIFYDSNTEEREFYLLDGSSVRAPLMAMASYKSQYACAYDGFKVLKMPYEQGSDNSRAFSMYIYLPDARDGLPSLVERVCSESGFIDTHLPPSKRQPCRICRVPKFKIAFEFEASDLLKSMGLVLPFCMGGLTEMVECSDLLGVTNIFHKSFVEVNEKGTEAAAYSGARYGGGGAPEDSLTFVADHPFLFVIREDISGLILFIGQLLNPLA